jgi:hypothetical protein
MICDCVELSVVPVTTWGAFANLTAAPACAAAHGAADDSDNAPTATAPAKYRMISSL